MTTKIAPFNWATATGAICKGAFELNSHCGDCAKCTHYGWKREPVSENVVRLLRREPLIFEEPTVSEADLAIRQHLSRPRPGISLCGCMGPQALRGEEGKDYYSAKRAPVCPCAMDWVEEVNGKFFKVNELRKPDGISRTATELGPVGGPYKCDQYGRIV